MMSNVEDIAFGVSSSLCSHLFIGEILLTLHTLHVSALWRSVNIVQEDEQLDTQLISLRWAYTIRGFQIEDLLV